MGSPYPSLDPFQDIDFFDYNDDVFNFLSTSTSEKNSDSQDSTDNQTSNNAVDKDTYSVPDVLAIQSQDQGVSYLPTKIVSVPLVLIKNINIQSEKSVIHLNNESEITVQYPPCTNVLINGDQVVFQIPIIYQAF